MDILQEYASQAYSLYLTADPYLRPVKQTIYTLRAQSAPYTGALLDRATAFAQDSPAVVTLAIAAFIVVVLFRILSFMRRILAFWVSVVFRLTFWMAVGLLISWVWQRGVGKTGEDLVVWGREIQRIWEGEYKKWEAQSRGGRGSAFGGGKNRWS